MVSCILLYSLGPIVCVTISDKGILVRNTSPSSKLGIPPEYNFVYLYVFLIPDPNSSAKPISRNTFDILGFLEKGSKFPSFNDPKP